MTSPLRYAFLAIPLLGLAELAAHLWFAKRPPSFDDWFTVVPAVRETRREGDLVVIAPSWADPAARRALGDQLMPLRDVARPDATRYEHAVELSILGERSPELAGWREESVRREGKFLLRRLENPAVAHVVYDFTDHARPPFADVRGTEPPVTCTWNPQAQLSASGPFGHPVFPRERFECPGGVFFNVGVTVLGDEELRPRRCVWSHPFARGEVVTRFHHVPLGRTIRGHGGIYWIVEREKRAPVTLTVRVDGDTVGRVVHRDGDGWAPFQLDLGAHAGQADAEVEIAVSSPAYHERHFCFEADTDDRAFQTRGRLGLADLATAFALAFGYVVWLVRTAGNLGYARDEGFYFQAASSYGRWFELLLSDRHAALQRGAVDAAWATNHEHPALIKSLFALSSVFLQKKHHLFAMEGTSYRFPAMVLAGCAVALVYVWGTQARGRIAGLSAAVLLAAMPRFFFHAHLACFDAPIVALWTLAAYAYWRSLRDGGVLFPLLTGVCFGLALDTKHNSWFWPFACTAHFVALQLWALMSRTRLRPLIPIRRPRAPRSSVASRRWWPWRSWARW